MKHSSHCNSLCCSFCSPLLLQLSASLAWDILMTIHIKQNVLSNSGELRLWRYLKNAGSMGWVLVWWRYMTQQLLSVQKHLPYTLQWLSCLQVHVFTWWTITPILGVTAFTFTFTTTIALRIHVYNNVVWHTERLSVSKYSFWIFSTCFQYLC